MTADFDKTHGFKELGADAVLSTWFSSSELDSHCTA
jgi:hypothetical protein